MIAKEFIEIRTAKLRMMEANQIATADPNTLSAKVTGSVVTKVS